MRIPLGDVITTTILVEGTVTSDNYFSILVDELTVSIYNQYHVFDTAGIFK